MFYNLHSALGKAACYLQFETSWDAITDSVFLDTAHFSLAWSSSFRLRYFFDNCRVQFTISSVCKIMAGVEISNPLAERLLTRKAHASLHAFHSLPPKKIHTTRVVTTAGELGTVSKNNLRRVTLCLYIGINSLTLHPLLINIMALMTEVWRYYTL